MNIVLYFGSFNPIHRAHLAIAKRLSREDGVDKVWLVVSPHNPLKSRSSLAPGDHRLAMATMAIKEFDLSCSVEVSDIEFTMDQPSYTYLTLVALRSKYPEHSFSMVMGSDNLSQITQWREWESILSSTTIYLYPRRGYDIDMSIVERYDIRQLGNVELYDLSSTDIRAKKVGGDKLAPSTQEYIKNHNLYK